MRHPDDYRLERWLAALFSLLFLLPVVADAQPLAAVDTTYPACSGDVGPRSQPFEPEPDVRLDAPASPFEMSIRVTASKRRTPC